MDLETDRGLNLRFCEPLRAPWPWAAVFLGHRPGHILRTLAIRGTGARLIAAPPVATHGQSCPRVATPQGSLSGGVVTEALDPPHAPVLAGALQ